MNLINAVTIDLEDYFQVEAFASRIDYAHWDEYPCRVEQNTEKILDILDNYPVKATFFCLGWIAERYPKLIENIAQNGHEVAAHGYAHKPVYKQSPEVFRQDIRKTKQILEDIVGKAVIGYRAPSWSITKNTIWALEILTEEGYKYDSSIFPVGHNFYGISDAPRFPFIINNGSISKRNNLITQLTNDLMTASIEFPITTLRIFRVNIPIAGGGYFRLLPYVFIRKALHYINTREKQPFIFYLHPWELDHEQPRINQLPWRSRFRHYVNLEKTECKFKKLLSDFRFSTVLEVLKKY